jgi:hypothetical protein
MIALSQAEERRTVVSSLQRCRMAVAAILSFLPGAQAAEPSPLAVVLASTAPGYATGQVIERAAVEIPDGASTTFLLPSGQAVTIKGPYAGALAAQGTAARSGLAQLLAPGQDNSEIGGTRSLDEGQGEDTLTLDPGAGGTFCIGPETRVRLTRPADPAFVALELRHGPGGKAVTLDWPDGGALAWPATLPLEAGTVTVRSVSTGAERRIELRPVAREGRRETAWAAALALAGCRDQATAVLERLREAMVPLDVYLASDRGRYPVYHEGEAVELVIRTNRDAFLYCLLREVRGEMRLLFPPQPGQARLAGNRTLTLPGTSPAGALRAGAGLKDGEIRCIASERDLASQLPQLAGAAGAVPLLEETVTALDAVTADSRQGQIVMTQLILRVED